MARQLFGLETEMASTPPGRNARDTEGNLSVAEKGSRRPAWALAVKRWVDVAVSIVGLIATSPLMCVIALTVKLFSKGPVFFSQQRCGLGGKPFRVLKFRSMVVGADGMRQDIEHLNEMTGPVFKVSRDPRVTSLGRMLRRFSLDELPQLWNVLRGDMSLVGPRPLPTEEAAACTAEQKRREEMRPGLICLWQVRGRSDIRSFEEWMRSDIEYVDNWSLWLDFKILLAAVPAVLLGRGAR